MDLARHGCGTHKAERQTLLPCRDVHCSWGAKTLSCTSKQVTPGEASSFTLVRTSSLLFRHTLGGQNAVSRALAKYEPMSPCRTIKDVYLRQRGPLSKKAFSNALLVTVLFEAVKAVRVFTSQRNICLSSPADATNSLSLAYAKAFT